MENHSSKFSNTQDLKDFLDFKYQQYNHKNFIESDPIQIPHQFNKKEDIEISGFLSATIAWGQRSVIIRNAKQLMNWMDHSPHDFIINHISSELTPFKDFKHRTFNGQDCLFFIERLRYLYLHYGSLENAFFVNKALHIEQNISNFKEIFMGNFQHFRSAKHIADPMKGSSAKRLNMFLRWMVRKDKAGVDFGIWTIPKASMLYCPLDVHSGNVARKLGLLSRVQNDWKAVCELTHNLRILDPQDPVKYDYALFGLGVFENY